MHRIEKARQVVIAARAVSASHTAAEALVDHQEFTAFVESAHRFHEPATGRGPVSRVHVDMHRPQAGGAVIRVAVAGNLSTAVCAMEVFAGTRETPRQKAPRFVDPYGARRD